MDQRIESFLADVLALAGEDPDAAREGVRLARRLPGDVPAQEANKAWGRPSCHMPGRCAASLKRQGDALA